MIPNARRHHSTPHLVLGSVAINILSLALPITTLQVYDRILPNPDSGTLPLLVTGVMLAILLETCLRIARSWILGWNGAAFEHDASVKAMRHVLATDISRNDKDGTGVFINKMMSIARLKDFNNGYVAVTVTEALFIPVFLGVIIYIAAPLAFIPLSLVLVFTGFSALQGARFREALKAREKSDDARYNFLIDCLKGIHTIKSFAVENMMIRRYERLQEKSSLDSFHSAEAATAAFNASAVLSHIMMACVITTGAIFVINGHITTGALIATLQLSGRLMQPVQRALGLWAQYQDMQVASARVASLFNRKRHDDPVATTLNAPVGDIKLENVSFGTALKNINLHVTNGKCISICSRSGAGKTLLLEMIAGLFPADNGTIEIDGTDIRHYPADKIVQHVGYLAADGMIFHGTIRDNITRFGTTPEHEAQTIARMLRVDTDVARLNHGFDTMLQSDGNDGIPPGLRQRIAMTRVLAGRPKVILFDDADRALDRDGYNLVYSMLGRLRRHTAMIIVSEDANLLALADRHYRIEDGALVAQPPVLHNLYNIHSPQRAVS